MKKRLLLTLALVSSSSAFAGGVSSGASSAYPHSRFAVVFSGGEAKQNSNINTSALTDQGYTGVSASAGKAKQSSGRVAFQYHFTPRWALDVGVVDFGDPDFNATVTALVGKTDAQVAQDIANATTKRGNNRVYSAGVQYRLPIAARTSIHLGLGAVAWKDQQNITVNGTRYQFNADGTDPYVRLGLGYDINRRLSLVSHIERYALDKPVNRWDIGLAVRF